MNEKTPDGNVELSLGDKMWLVYGSNLIVGYFVDQSPRNKMIFMSPLDCETFKEKKDNDEDIPGSWLDPNHIKLIDFEKGAGLFKKNKKVGF
jgi:hypothetical protein